MKAILFSLALVSALSGCAVPMADPAKDAQLKEFKIDKDKSAVYIYRNETMGAAVRMDVAVDGAPLGRTAAHTYLYKELTPGKHVITSTAENTETLEIDAKPGVLTYIWQEVKMGILMARNKLHLVDEEEGQAGVKESKLAESK
ncbi:DUF2846 domain-containing protein [Herbaspirillum huttiense]|uniref:DUF2846 domain-containing protein n=1 Tax=Herbaspirillum huttiense TaxID=863372 RepID=UPI00041F181A|nr:DUF2846 domain-containing protein [Herbaspirillum huttiense]MBN9358420.1 DUF2846 domain-containing protein [Herbaspirillum huttiense]